MKFGSGDKETKVSNYRFRKRFAFLPVRMSYTKTHVLWEWYYEYVLYSEYSDEIWCIRRLTKQEYRSTVSV